MLIHTVNFVSTTVRWCGGRLWVQSGARVMAIAGQAEKRSRRNNLKEFQILITERKAKASNVSIDNADTRARKRSNICTYVCDECLYVCVMWCDVMHVCICIWMYVRGSTYVVHSMKHAKERANHQVVVASVAVVVIYVVVVVVAGATVLWWALQLHKHASSVVV